MAVAAAPILKARNTGGGAIRLVVTPDADAVSYKVYRDETTTPTTLIDSTVAMPYFDETGASGVDYFYRVKATNGSGDSAYSNQIHVLRTDTYARKGAAHIRVSSVASGVLFPES